MSLRALRALVMARVLLLLVLLGVLVTGSPLRWGLGTAAGTTPLRYMSANVGNAAVGPGTCFEHKLCNATVAANIAAFVTAYRPDVVLLMEVLRAAQLPQLCPAADYDGACGLSVSRVDGAPALWNASNASHQHECVCWKRNRFTLLANASEYGRNDDFGKAHCHYDFTAFAVTLLDRRAGATNITFVAVHPDSVSSKCKDYEISNYWSKLARGRAVVSGDWNSGRKCYLGVCVDSVQAMQMPPSFWPNYLVGQHADGTVDGPADCCPTAVYADGAMKAWLDASFSNFGTACTACGKFYGTASLPHGSAVGSYADIPRADGGSGCDHRQLLVDLLY